MYLWDLNSIAMGKIKNIVFDLGGVIIDLDRDEPVRRLIEIGVKDADGLIDPYEQKGVFQDLETGKIEMTSQNHSYAVDEASLAGTGLTVTHRNLLDGTVEGQKCAADRVFSVQYHPESAPGPQDSGYLFGEFLQSMKEAQRDAEKN